MSDKNILEVYKKRKYNEFLIEKRTKLEEIENNDPVVKAFNKAVENLKKVLADNKISNMVTISIENGELSYSGYTMADKTVEAMNEVENAFKDKMDDRDRVIEEVTAQLMSIENYDQEMAIYKRYGIIDGNGLIYDYKDKENN